MLQDTKLRFLIGASTLVTLLEILSLSGIRLPFPLNLVIFSILSLAIGYETLKKGFIALSRLNFQSINLLMTIAVIGAFWLGEYEEAAVVIILFNLAERLEFVGFKQSKSAIAGLTQKMPKKVLLLGADDEISVDLVKIGDKIVLKPHEMIPLDGRVIEGSTFIDESAITGEPIAADKRIGDSVFAGTMNLQGSIVFEVTKDPASSTVAKIEKLTLQALENKASTQKFIEKFSSYYTPFVILLSLLWLIVQTPFSKAFSQSITLLVISCPCALVISTPMAIFASLGRASSLGALIKGGRYLEALGQVEAMAFDKTRTITIGEPVVSDVIPFHGHDPDHLLACAAGLELFSEHPIAKSIVNHAKVKSLVPHKAEGFSSHVGKGAQADCLVCSTKSHYIGKLEFILENHKIPDYVLQTISSLQSQGKTVVVVSTPKEVEGVIGLQDALRKEAPDVIQTLKKMKIHTSLLTGDHRLAAEQIRKEAGIDSVSSELLPEDKLREIERLKSRYQTVAMVGDGVNDAPALAASDVGLSMTTLGSDTALEAADVVLLGDHLNTIPKLIELGKKALSIIRFNTLFALTTKFAVIVLALTGNASLALAIFADVGVTILVILNCLRLMY